MISEKRDFQTRKSELEQKLDRLEQDRAALIAEVQSLRERRTLLELAAKASSLQQTVDLLRKEKEELEIQIASLAPKTT